MRRSWTTALSVSGYAVSGLLAATGLGPDHLLGLALGANLALLVLAIGQRLRLGQMPLFSGRRGRAAAAAFLVLWLSFASAETALLLPTNQAVLAGATPLPTLEAPPRRHTAPPRGLRVATTAQTQVQRDTPH